MQIRKICIKSIAVFMAAIVMVSTPLSRFADTKGVSDTHAVAPALITLGGLFGAIAGAYGLYVAADKLGDMAEGWFNWTADNAVDARTDLQKIKDGVTSYVVSKVVMESVADFLATQEAPSVTVQVKNKIIESYGGIDTFPSNEFTDSFGQHFNDWYIPYYGTGNMVGGYWEYSSEYSSGMYHFIHSPKLEQFKNKIADMSNVDKYALIFYCPSTAINYSSSYMIAFDEAGLPIYTLKSSDLFNNYYRYYSDGWTGSYSSLVGRGLDFSTILSKCSFLTVPIIYSKISNPANATLSEILAGTRESVLQLDYNTHGSSALDNTDALTDAELTEAQLQAIHQAVEEEYSNVVQFPNSGVENEEEPDTQALANAITLAVLNALQNMGYVKNPTDDPSGENVKEQLGNIQISLDGLIDAISQINPVQGLANIAQGIAELPQKITASVPDAIRNVFEDLFVPDEGAIQDKVDEITDKFAFADSLLTVVDDIDGALKNASGPPEIYIHFEDAEDSKYTPIGTLKLLSFEWYERYKPYGDALLSSMLWLFFLWKVRKRIAEIVQGLSVSGESDTNTSANSAIGIERGRSS